MYKDIFRILRPGGRLSVADIVLRGSPEALQGFPKSIALRSWCACVSGALVEEEYLATIRDAGFADVRLVGEHAAGVTAVAVTITARKPPEQPLLASDPYEWAPGGRVGENAVPLDSKLESAESAGSGVIQRHYYPKSAC
ncbi:MAG TPA: hypothetical protein VKE24_09980 [Candidatus Acidoferrales bacterium]|nr:hypothetical protein [Candidatus Acidoferrales bacterium]